MAGPGQRLEIRQTAQLVMTPQLQQAIRLLQMSNLELIDFVAAEAERNPLIEIDSGFGERAAPRETETPLEAAVASETPGAAEAALDAAREALWDEAVADLQTGWRQAGAHARVADLAEVGVEGFAAPPLLRDHLIAQIGTMRGTAPALALAALLVDELDEDGYLRVPADELIARHGAAPETLAAAIALVQDCEPTGVGARTLGECLALQLAEGGELDDAAQAVLARLDLVAAGDHAAVMRAAGIGAEELARILARLRALDPRPGRAWGGGPVAAIVPDVIVSPDALLGWSVELNAETLPRFAVAGAYGARVARAGGPAKAYVAECRASATWLVSMIESRARTILKVAAEIVRVQEGFLAAGISALRPLTLREVAERVGVHESTVSRVTSGKYMICPRGIFELRFFFGSAVESANGGEAVAAAAIRHRIRRLVEAEEPGDILSDDRLVALLRAGGVAIARRTVAKYREALRIPSSVERRRTKLLRAARTGPAGPSAAGSGSTGSGSN